MSIAIAPSGASHTRTTNVTDTASFWIVVHVVVWTIYGSISQFPGDIHHDMAEAYVWGREFQLGYYKHPPFWAHVAGLWFQIFPRADWTFYLLAVTNSALGIGGVWLIAGRYLTGEKRLAAMLLLQSLPVFHFLAFKFNANTIFLSIWPLAIYFYLRLIEERRLSHAVALGIICAGGLLSKYFFGVLLAAFCLAVLLDRQRRAILGTALPWIAAGVCLLMVGPHLWWLASHEASTLTYISGLIRSDWLVIGQRVVTFLLAVVAFHAAMFVVFLLIVEEPRKALGRIFCWRTSCPRRRHLIMLAVFPALIATAIALFSGVRLDSNYAIGTVPLASVILLMTPAVKLKPGAITGLKRAVLCFMAAALVASPLIGTIRFAKAELGATQPRSEAARAVSALWAEETGQPLSFVAGSWPYASAVAFYAPGDVSEFTDFSRKKAPWVDQTRLLTKGIVVICEVSDTRCMNAAFVTLGAETTRHLLRLQRSHMGWKGEAVELLYLIYSPVFSEQQVSRRD